MRKEQVFCLSKYVPRRKFAWHLKKQQHDSQNEKVRYHKIGWGMHPLHGNARGSVWVREVAGDAVQVGEGAWGCKGVHKNRREAW